MGIGKSINVHICGTHDTHNCLTKAAHEGRSFKDFPVYLSTFAETVLVLKVLFIFGHMVFFPTLTIL